MKIQLPDTQGKLETYTLVGEPIPVSALSGQAVRTVFSATHVVANPWSDNDPASSADIDWEKTLAYRHYLADLGLGIAEAMDTAQRGMGLDWNGALELIRRTRQDLPEALVFNGCGTDHLDLTEVRDLDQVYTAYMHQLDEIQSVGGRIILMASRALVKVARSSEEYIDMYSRVLSACDQPVILHWLGEMFDPALSGYWGSNQYSENLSTCLEVINANESKIDGIKISLLDKEKEIQMRRQLPATVRMYTGDDFNYPELIQGDNQGYSHALLGIFDPIAPAAAHAVNLLGQGDTNGFRQVLDPTVPLARLIFKAPTQYYKTGVVFMAWLNGFQDHFVMLGGAQSMRSLPYFVDVFKLADTCGLLRNPDLAVQRMQNLMSMYGVR